MGSTSRRDRSGATHGAQSRKSAGRHRKASKSLLSQAIDFLPDPTFAIDLSGKVLVWNRAMEVLTNIRSEDMVGKGDYEYALPFHGERRPILIDMVLRENGELRKKYTSVRMEGDSLYAEAVGLPSKRSLYGKACPIYDDGGTIVGAIESIWDITDRKQAEETLRQSEERYRGILNDMEETYYEVDLKGRFTFFNPSMERTYGYSEEEIMGAGFTEFMDRDNAEKVFSSFHRVYITGKTMKGVDWKLRHKDGREVYVEASVSLRWDAQGNRIGFRGITRDITERRRAEEALRESAAVLNSIFEATPAGVALIKDRLFHKVNAALCTISGYTEAELVGASTRLLYIDDESYARSGSELYAQMEKSGLATMEARLRHKDGTVVNVVLCLSPIDPKDLSAGACVTTLDTTALRQAEEKSRESEEKFSKVFLTSPDCIAITRVSDGKILDVNLGFEEITGWKRSEAMGRTSYEINFWGDTETRDFMVKDLKEGKDILSREFTFRKKDGTVRPGLFSARTIDISGEACLIFVLQDIADKRQLEDERQKLEQQLFQAQKMESIGRLAGGIAHDFNNILSAIIGYSELAVEDLSAPEKARRELKEVLKAGERAKNLVRQILTFSRNTGTLYLPVELSAVIRDSLKMLRSVIPSTIEIRQDLAESGLVMSNSTLVNQIVMNLCTNAAQAMSSEGGVMVVGMKSVSLDQEEASGLDVKPGAYVRLTVSDTGYGMPPEVMEHIFEPYFTTKELGSGTGLGLSVVHGIVKSHEGNVICRSTPGEGSTFEVYLPEVESADRSPRTSENESVPTGTERILFVDDEAALAGLASEMLGKLGYKVTILTGSVDAFELFGQKPGDFDLVITDMTMPVMTGDRLAEKIMEIRPDIPVILCTGYSDRFTEEDARAKGIRQFVMKPFEMKALAQAIRKALEGPARA